MTELKIILGEEILCQLVVFRVYQEGTVLCQSSMRKSELEALKNLIESEKVQILITPETIKRIHQYLSLEYYEPNKIYQSVQYLLDIGKVNFQLDEEDLLEQANSLALKQLDFEDIHHLLWMKALNASLFVTQRTDLYRSIIDACELELGSLRLHILSVSEFLKLPGVLELKKSSSPKIIVYTPAGNRVILPENATVIDFAYRIHSEVGDRCKSGLVNGTEQPFNSKLKSGDVIEIIKDRNSHPRYEWLEFAVTTTAKSGIRRWFRNNEIQRGRTLLENALRQKVENMSEGLNEIIRTINCKTLNNLFRALAHEEISINEIIDLFNRVTQQKLYERILSGSISEVLLQIGDRSYRMSGCCRPFPGEPVVAVIRNSNLPVPIHRPNCPNLINVKPKYIHSINLDFNRECRAFLEIKMVDEEGVFLSITDVLRANSIRFDIRQITTYPDQTTAKTRIATTVRNQEELDRLIHLIRSVNAVLRVRVLGLMQIPDAV
jgi:hypothetical protein